MPLATALHVDGLMTGVAAAGLWGCMTGSERATGFRGSPGDSALWQALPAKVSGKSCQAKNARAGLLPTPSNFSLLDNF